MYKPNMTVVTEIQNSECLKLVFLVHDFIFKNI